MERFISGESKKIFRVHWSDARWKACLAAGGGDKRRFQYCPDASEKLFISEQEAENTDDVSQTMGAQRKMFRRQDVLARRIYHCHADDLNTFEAEYRRTRRIH